MDTAPLIYYLEGDDVRAPLVRLLLVGATQGRYSLVVSAVTEAELLVAPLRRKDEAARAAVGDLLDGEAISKVEAVSREIARRSAQIRAETMLRLPDAIVAATALDAGCSALLGNDSKFRRLKEKIAYLHLDDQASP